MEIWQIASGAEGRDYSRFFVSHDLMCVGPGDPGEYEDSLYQAAAAKGALSQQRANTIGDFCRSVQPGDVVLLRQAYRVVALGVVSDEGYSWDPGLDDVHGWDLQHTRRVVWQDHLAGELARVQEGGMLFRTRKQIPMFTRVKDEQVLAPIRHLLSEFMPRELRARPADPSAKLNDAEVARELFSRGLSNQNTEQVVAALARQRRLLTWYAEHGRPSGRPTEHEVVAHMVLPLLLALGWSEQLLAVEWNHIDLAGFSMAPTTAAACSLVCEAKGLGHGLRDVLEQAKGYVGRRELTNCRRILLTDGGRYYLYRGGGESWPDDPTAYFNVERLRIRNSDGTNAIDAIMGLRQA